MAIRIPLVMNAGQIEQLQSGDTLTTGQGILFIYDGSLDTSVDPGSGQFALNSFPSTEFAISETDAQGNDVSEWIHSWDDSSGTIRAKLFVQVVSSGDLFVYNILANQTDNGAWVMQPVAELSTGSISNGDYVRVWVQHNGDTGAAGLKYTYSTTTSAADPGSGFLRFNNATLASATSLFISETDGDGNGIAALLATWDDSTSTVRGKLTVSKENDPTKFVIYNITGTITDNGTWDTFTVAYVTGTTLANNDLVRLHFSRTGDLGATGSTGATGANGKDGLMMGGRLTLATGTPIPSADQTAKTTVYLTPWHHQYIALYDGSDFVRYEYTSDVSVAVPSTTNKPFDIFAYQSSGTVTLETVDWTNDTTRATALTRLKGTWVKSGDGTRRYLGTGRTTSSSGQTEDSQAARLLWNMYNRVPRKLKKSAGVSTWTQTNSSGVYRAANSDSNNHFKHLSGLAEELVYIDLAILVQGSLTATDGQVNIGVNSTTTPAGSSELRVTGTASAFQIRSTSYLDVPAMGYNEFYWIEASTNTTTVFPGASRFEGFSMM